MTGANAAMERNLDIGEPVRVVRGYNAGGMWAPTRGFRYVAARFCFPCDDGPLQSKNTNKKKPDTDMTGCMRSSTSRRLSTVTTARCSSSRWRDSLVSPLYPSEAAKPTSRQRSETTLPPKTTMPGRLVHWVHPLLRSDVGVVERCPGRLHAPPQQCGERFPAPPQQCERRLKDRGAAHCRPRPRLPRPRLPHHCLSRFHFLLNSSWSK